MLAKTSVNEPSGVRRIAGAAMIAIVIAASGNVLFAATCWSDYQDRLVAAHNTAMQCQRDIPWGTAEGALLGNQMQALCGAQQVSDALEAEVKYISCMSIDTFFAWLAT